MFIIKATGMDRGIPVPIRQGKGGSNPGDDTEENSEIPIQGKELRGAKKKE